MGENTRRSIARHFAEGLRFSPRLLISILIGSLRAQRITANTLPGHQFSLLADDSVSEIAIDELFNRGAATLRANRGA